MGKVRFICCIFILLCITGCGKKENALKSADTGDLNKLPQEIQDVVYQDKSFYDVHYEKEYNKSSYQLKAGKKVYDEVNWDSYLVFDIDNDKEQELLVELNVHVGGEEKSTVRVFDQQNGKVYGYRLPHGLVLDVYEDGAIKSWTDSNDIILYTVKFREKDLEQTVIADQEDLMYEGRQLTDMEFEEVFEKEREDGTIAQIPWGEGSLDEKIAHTVAEQGIDMKDGVIEEELLQTHQYMVEYSENLTLLPESIQQVLRNEKLFYDVESKKECTKESYKLITEDMEEVPVQWQSFIVFDVDMDGENELIVDIGREGASQVQVKILDNQGGNVYAYSFVFRSVLHVTDDGMIWGSSGAADNDECTLHFEKDKCKEILRIRYETYQEEIITYYFEGKEISKEEFSKYYDEIIKTRGLKGEERKEIPRSFCTLDEKLREW